MLGLAGMPARLAAREGIIVPAGTCLLTRRLERSLHDGKAIVVTRSWRIGFTRQARGIAVSGEQVSVSVDAPDRLAPLARIEEERSTLGMFPILLGPAGTIVAAGANSAQDSLDAAIKIALDLLGQGEEPDMPGAEKSAHAAYLAQLQQAGSTLMDQMPGDLFYPSTEPFRTTRRIAMPDGEDAEFEMTWKANTREGSGLLESAQREIITRIGKSQRHSREEWSLKVL
jgi:hypothetical protein